MIYYIWDYFLPTLGILFGAALCLFVGVWNYNVAIPKKTGSRRDPVIVLRLYILSLVTLLLIAIYAIPSTRYWADAFDASSRDTVVGRVDSIRSAGVTPVYYDRKSSKLCLPSFITISGIDYYALSGEGIHDGDILSVTYCIEGKAILEWHPIDDEMDDVSNGQDGYDTGDTKRTSQRSFLLSPTQAVIIFCVILVVSGLLDRPDRRSIVLGATEFAVPGAVSARKINVLSCKIEMLVTCFAVLALLTGRASMIIFSVILSICLWGLRYSIQKTIIRYDDTGITVTTLWSEHTYSVDEIASIRYSQNRQGYLQLQLTLINGRRIWISQQHFQGLYQFYKWFAKTGGM